MTDSSGTARYAADLIGGFADTGADIAFISPGSRNTPLTLAIANEPRIRDISLRDERSAAFVALGCAKATDTPAIVVCTSGSAPAHYLPAIMEADQSETPLIVLTADRPKRLRGTGAPQATDQVDLYGSHVKAFADLDPTDATSGRSCAIELMRTALEVPAGPVHANLPFDEPLLSATAVPPGEPSQVDVARKPWTERTDLFSGLEDRSVMIVVSGRGGPELSRRVTEAAERLAAPVFADPQANITGATVLRYGDLIVGPHDGPVPVALASHAPDVVVRLGPIPTSKPMWQWLERSDVEQILVHASRLADPLKSATTVIDARPIDVLAHSPLPLNPDRSLLDAWLAMDDAVSEALDRAMTALPFPNEPEIARTVARSTRGETALFVASSRPIRDVDAFATARSEVRVLANRGVNGIDGTISTAIGVALTGIPTTLLIGDVAALHDISALAEAARLSARIRIVVVNNDGGGIFSFLPQATSSVMRADIYERHWGTPHGLKLTPIADAMGVPTSTIKTREALTRAVASRIDGPELLEIVTDRSTNVGHHEALRAAVADVLVS
ncbi:MAG: 2-succinyl-5-enolpyruvyl-6-hydroxy-3-cyclohexene-1-carboxylic-acid synthase [Acidimicrobiia bacterium]|nr:MAG: 2-succinyl-5-enolpyruvyl-6-hydroxy-3-cyclohexene-1-carboxylic-acid synthase [Acidimicrobiia bacterium]